MRSPAFKLCCYLIVTLLTAVASELEPLTAAAVAGWTWLEWTKTAIAVLIPTALVWRAFVDQSLSNPAAPTVTTTTNSIPDPRSQIPDPPTRTT
jgi:hypothetical protein